MMEGNTPSECNLIKLKDLEVFIIKQLRLLEIERKAEVEENKCLQENVSMKSLQAKGLCIPKLRVAHMSPGLFGRLIIKFSSTHIGGTIATNSISSGDIVGISNVNSDGRIKVIVSGVISHVHDTCVTVALEKDSDSTDLEFDGIFSIIKLANDVTYRRLKRILKILQNESEKIPLANTFFDSKSLSTLEVSNITFFNNKLNEIQKKAVQFALSQKEVAILHGPPGTGKTTTLVECILQSVAQKLKVIACAPSNIAVDNLMEKLACYKIKMVRLGHPARVLPEIQKYSLDAIISQYDGCDVIQDIQSEISKLKVKIENTKGPKKFLLAENKNLLKEMRERQKAIMKQILTNADVVLSTLTSASEDGPLKHTEEDHFDICFIDECSQALETACWIPLRIVKKCVIAGDHNQLPPTIISETAAKEGLSLTLMERLLKLFGSTIKMMLTVQYRMNEIIMQWPSKQLYDDKLISHSSVHSHLLADLSQVKSNEDTNLPLLLIDTAGCNLYELHIEEEESKGNEGEADLVSVHVENLVRSGVNPLDIAVITPYNLQVDLIKSRCSKKYPKLEIKSVDGFQGREKEAVILSLVRSNDLGEVGFLLEDRRINVAITRAKRHLTIICNTTTVSNSNFLKSFVSYCEEKGEVRSAFQYENKIGHYSINVQKRISKVKQSQCKLKKKNSSKSFDVVPQEVCKPEKSKRMNEMEWFTAELKYRQIIQDFIKSAESSFSFSEELSTFERRVVHELSEELGLLHISQGEGDKRFIFISKAFTSDTSCCDPLNSKEVAKSLDNPCSDNFFGHELSNDKFSNNSHNTSVNVKKICLQKSTEQKFELKNASKSKLKTLAFKETSEDFDALIFEAVTADKTCFFDKCKKCVAVLSQVCQFCKGRFCFSHFIPEAHGCGHLAKSHARSQIRKDGAVYAGSCRPEVKVDPSKKSYLQKKLNEKINSMTSQRKSKPKS